MPTFTGGVSVASGDWDLDGYLDIATGAGAGGGPHVRVFSGQTGEAIVNLFAYDLAFTGGVSVAMADVTGDGRLDLITGAGAGGGPHVRVFDGRTLLPVFDVMAYDLGFTGGVSVAAADLDGDGRAEVVTGAGVGGGPHVRAFSVASGAIVGEFMAFDPTDTGGVSVAAGDITGDGKPEIVTGAGPGGLALVRAFSGPELTQVFQVAAFDPAWVGGVRVAVGDLDGDGRGEVLTAAMAGGGPHVRAFFASGDPYPTGGNLFAYSQDFRGGVFLAAGDLDADGKEDLITGAGAGGGPHVRGIRSGDLASLAEFMAYDPDLRSGGFSKAGSGRSKPVLDLSDTDQFLAEGDYALQIPATASGVTLQLPISSPFAAGDTSPDVVNFFLLDAADPTRTLVDQGVNGTPFLTATAAGVRPAVEGGVRFDGETAFVDVTRVGGPKNAILRAQIVNLDGLANRRVTALQPAFAADPTAKDAPLFPASESVAGEPSGPAANADALAEPPGVRGELSNVRFSSAAGVLTADLVLVNDGPQPVGRNLIARFPDLPADVTLANPSGTDGAGRAYLSVRDAAPVGGLGVGERTAPVTVRFANPNRRVVSLRAAVAAGENTPPVIGDPGAAWQVTPGDLLDRVLPVGDADGDPLTLGVEVRRNGQVVTPAFPLFQFDASGRFRVVAKPGQEGSYELVVTVSDGAAPISRTIPLQVLADTDTRTRVSGTLLNTADQPIAGVRVQVVSGGTTDTATTDASGNFFLPLSVPATATSRLRVLGQEVTAPAAYHLVDMPLAGGGGFLGRDAFAAANNRIPNPVYLQALDTANAVTVDPSRITYVKSSVPGLYLTIPANSLRIKNTTQNYTGRVALSVVRDQKTPMPLAAEFLPEYVITFQPLNDGTPPPELVFASDRSGTLTQPYSGPLEIGSEFELIGFNDSGVMERVGKAKVADALEDPTADPNDPNANRVRALVTTPGTGGLRTGSCDFYVPPKVPVNTNNNPANEDDGCVSCKVETPLQSTVEMHSGALHEDHTLATYQSLGATRGVTLSYDSLRADPRPVVNFGAAAFDAVSSSAVENTRLVARMELTRGGVTTRVDGAERSPLNPTGGEHFWRVAAGQTSYQAALQANLRGQPTGRYQYAIDAGLLVTVNGRLRGRTAQEVGEVISVNEIGSAFGAGWGVAGLQKLVVEQAIPGLRNADGTADEGGVLLIDGDGTQMFFRKKGAMYAAPPGDFSTLVALPGGRFTRTLPDGTVSTFNAALDLESVRDRNGNTTAYRYRAAGQILEIEDPVGLKTAFTYGPNGKVAAITNPDGRQTVLAYDAVGNLRSVTDPDGATRTWSYDTGRRMTGERDARGLRETATYTFAGRVAEGRLKDGTVKRVAPLQTRALYNPDRTTSFAAAPVARAFTTGEAFVADANGNVTAYTLDRAGQAVSSRDWEGTMGSVVRNGANLVARSNDARGNATAQYHDARGNTTEVIDNLAITSQTRRDSIGREFWISFQPNAGQTTAPTLELAISGYVATTGVVDLPDGTSQAFAVTPGQTTTVTVPTSALLTENDAVSTQGIRVAAERPVTVVGVNRLSTATDGFLALPADVIGTDYVVMSYRNGDDGRPVRGSYLAVVATRDGTAVTITPAARSGPDGRRAAGVPFTVQLNRGQTYYLANDTDLTGDMTGTTVTANLPVSVLGGHTSAFVPSDVTAANHLVEQLPPTSAWGTDFITTPAARRKDGDVIRVVAASDDTVVRVNGAVVATLNRGQFHEQFIVNPAGTTATAVAPVQISATKPVLVGQFATGQNRGGAPGDPFMLLLPPVSQFLETQTAVKPAGFSTNFITLVVPTAALPTLDVNGRTFGGTTQTQSAFYGTFPAEQAFAPVGTSGYSVGVLQYNVGEALTISAKEGFGLYSYGYSDFDNYGYLGGQSFEGFSRKTMAYDPTFSQLTEMTDELGHRTLYDVDPANGNTRKITRVMGLPDGSAGDTQQDLVTLYTHLPSGQIDTTIDPLGRVTDYDYDAVGRLVAVTAAKGTADQTTTRYEYFDGPAGLSGNVRAMIDGRGNRTEYEYDAMNRVVRVTEADPDGGGPLTSPVSVMRYDANGNLLTTQDALGAVTLYGYDPLNRRTATVAPDPDGTGPLAAPVTVMRYEPNGNLRAVTDPNGNTTQYRYDDRQRRISTIDPDGGLTAFGYDSDGNLTSLRDPGGNVTAFAYDFRGRQVAETDPLGQVTQYAFDAANRLDYMIDRLGRVTDYGYDDADRITGENWAGGGNTITYTYDLASNLVRIQDGFSTLTFTPDSLNRTQAVSNAGSPGGTPVIDLTYAHDANGNVRTVTDSLGGTTGYDYDALDRLVTLGQAGTGVTNKHVRMAYNALGQTTGLDRYLGPQMVMSSLFGYDGMHRLASITHGPAAGPAPAFSYQYDAGSRITQIASKTEAITYTYDRRDQLTGADYATNSQTDEGYRYDANGNRLQSQRHGAGYATDPNTANRLKSDGTYTYAYDANGNMVRRTAVADGSYREFAWDHRNRLRAITDRSAGGIITKEVVYTYDALDRRIAQTVGGVTQHYVYDREDVLFEFNGGTLATRNFHGPGIDQVLAQESNGAVQWLLTDHLGSTRAVLAANGAVQLVEYDSYGNPTAALPTRYGYTGREWDAGVGMWYYRARYYDAGVGRFVSEDPAKFLDDVSRYRYVHNLPTLAVDPSGLDTLVIVGAPTGSNPFGHVAIAVTSSGALSFGTGNDLGSSLQGYLTSQGEYRPSTAYLIHTTPAQEAAIVATIAQYANEKLPPVPSVDSNDTCGTRTNEALAAAGMHQIGITLASWFSLFGQTSPFPSDIAVTASFYANQSGGQTIQVPMGYDGTNPVFNQFEPKGMPYPLPR